MSRIKVLIADDHSLVREGLHRLLSDEPGIEVLGEAKDGEDAVNKTKELHPDIVLMDITMPGLDGLEASRLIGLQNPDVKILILTVHESTEVFFKALEVGASGYFIKGGSSNELLAALEVVAHGGVYLHPMMAKKLVGQYLRGLKQGKDQETYAELSKREKEILNLIAEGRNNRDIAELLNLSPNTVQTHRARLMIKLKLHSRIDLVRYAIRRGLPNPAPD